MKTKKLFSLLLLSIFYSCQESDNAIYTPLPEAKVGHSVKVIKLAN